jgi:hypothetical protein
VTLVLERCHIEALQNFLGERDASLLELQQGADAVRAELEAERKWAEGKLCTPAALVFSWIF